MNLNEKQQLAVDTIDRNVLLDASAGTGKTTVLVNRFVNILDKGDFSNIKEGDELASIVAITFTKKASNELKERISKLIYERAKTDDRLKNYYSSMPLANISTVHQFAFKMLKAYPLLAKIDPRAKVLEDDETDAILDKAIREALDELNYEELFKALDKNYDDFFISGIKSIINKTRAMDIDALESNTLSYIKSVYDEAKIKKAIKIIDMNLNALKGELKPSTKLYKLMEKHGKKIDTLADTDLADVDLLMLNDLAYGIGDNKKHAEEYQAISESARYILKALEVNMLDIYKAFFKLIKTALEKYNAYKDEESALDFNDLEVIFRDLLKRDELRENLKNKLSYIMVDEFQDTSQVQKEIYYLLNDALGSDRLFVVGDFKQSIYAFRGANASLYRSVKDDFISDEKSDTISMNDNYRTGKEIISSVNKLFADKIHGYEDLVAASNIEHSEVKMVTYADKNDKELEALAIANKIYELHEDNTDFRDIVILVRTNKDSKEIERALNKAKIPVYNTANKALNSRDEMENVYNFIHYLRYEDELSLIGILRSNFYGLDDDEIFMTKERDDFKYYKEELKKYVDLKKEVKLNEILETFFDDRDYVEKLLYRQRSAQSYANIRAFLDKIDAYYDGANSDADSIIDKLLAIRKTSQAEASYINEGDNLVRIMTIHKAKGLEAKVVICAQMSFKKPQDHDFAKIDDRRIFLKFKDLYSNYKEAKLRADELDEEEKIRNLYVMLTRAKEKLIVYKSNGNSGFNPYINDLLAISEEAHFDEVELVDPKMDKDIPNEDLITNDIRVYQNMYAELPSRTTYDYDFDSNSFKVHDDERDDLDTDYDSKKIGLAVHRFCEAYEGEDFEDILNASLKSFDIEKKYSDIVLTCAKNYHKFYNSYTNVKTYKEFEYYYKKDDIIYTGVIDRLNVYDDYIELIDYKVSTLDATTTKDIYSSQIAMYKEAVKSIFKKDVKAKIFLLTKDILIDME